MHTTLFEKAFRKDPFINYILGYNPLDDTPKKRQDMLKYIQILLNCNKQFQLQFYSKETTINNMIIPENSSICLWFPPNIDFTTNLWTNGILENFKIGFTAPRLTEFILKASSCESKQVAKYGTMYYLMICATDPEFAGNGLLKQGIIPVLEIADREGKACYLEATTFESTKVYQRFGFEVCNVVRMGILTTACEIYCMVRPPNAKA